MAGVTGEPKQFSDERIDKDLYGVHYTKGLWYDVLWTDESKLKLFGCTNSAHVRCRPKTALLEKNLIAAVKHDHGNVMVWSCLIASGTG